MPRVSFNQEFKSADTDRFPKLKLDTGEKSRLWIPSKEEPWMEWYHRIEAPMVEHGEPVLEVKDTRRGPIETWKMDWIGNTFCIGETGTPSNPGPLIATGIDPANCPACESAAKKTGVAPPQQRFALPVVKYKVKGRGSSPYDLASPISAEILIWAYTARIHGLLHELESEHGDLHKHDIKMELEDSPGADKYQKLKQLAVIVKPAYTDPKTREYLRDLWSNQENRPTDDQLRDACLGRDVPRLVMMDMVRRAERQYQQVEQAGTGGGDTAVADSAFNGDVASGVDALLDEGPKNEEALARVREMQDPWADEEKAAVPGGGGLDEFMSEAEKQAHFTEIEKAKQQADPTDEDIDSLPLGGGDPFAGETSPAIGATTTSTPAPAAEKVSRTAPKSAASAASSSDPDMLEDLESQTEPEPAKANGRKKAKAAEQPSLEPEPVKAAAGGAVIDFDDLFSD